MDLFRKYLALLVSGVVITAALLFYLLNIPANREANMLERFLLDAMAPVMQPFSQTGRFFTETWSGYVDLVNVRKENQTLKEQVKQLHMKLIEGQEASQANLRLNRLLEMKSVTKPKTLTASVIGEDGSSWFSTIVIDRGSSDGIRDGMAVMSAEGIVGQIVKVAANSSRVLLLTDHASGIAATIQRSRARGVVKGKGGGLCALEFTTREEDVKVGDVVVASGIGGIFMKGMPIGEVTMVKRGEYGIFQTVTIRPAVNIARLEEVLVVLRGGYE